MEEAAPTRTKSQAGAAAASPTRSTGRSGSARAWPPPRCDCSPTWPIRSARTSARGSGARSGSPGAPRPRSIDPETSFVHPDSVVRVVHSDLGAMMIGGVAALMLQALHPLAMAGVADHSAYEEDPIGRLRRTANFVGTTTFGTTPRPRGDQAREGGPPADPGDGARRTGVLGRRPRALDLGARGRDVLLPRGIPTLRRPPAAEGRVRPVLRGDGPGRDRARRRPGYPARSTRWTPTSCGSVPTSTAATRRWWRATSSCAGSRASQRSGRSTGSSWRPASASCPAGPGPELKIPTVPMLDAAVVAPAARLLCVGLRWAVPPKP
jgi:hypothetical protein